MQNTTKTQDRPREEPPLRRKGNRLYLSIWTLLGCSAAAYLVIAAIGAPLPEGLQWQAAQEDVASVSLRKSAEGDGNYARNDALAKMGRDIEALKNKVTTVTQTVRDLGTNQSQTQERVKRLETWQSVVLRTDNSEELIRTGAAPDTTATVVATEVRTTGADSEIEGTTLDGVTRTADPVQTGPTVSSGDDAAVLAALLSGDPEAAAAIGIAPPQGDAPAVKATNAAVEPTTEPEVAPAQKPIAAFVPIPGRRTFGVELGSGQSVESLRLKWALLNERHRDLIGTLAPRFVTSGTGDSELFRLIAGPFSSSVRARELCTQLQAYYVNCQTSAFTGKVL